MSPSARAFLCFAGLSLLSATGLGAYASHALDPAMDPSARQSLLIALDYQFYNSLGLLAVATLCVHVTASRWLAAAGWLLVAGIVLFCGAIYATSAGAPEAIGGAAPFGGICLMAGWASFAIGAWRAQRGAASA